jgi:hypothetical protein
MRDASHLFGDSRIPDRVWSKIRVEPCGCWTWTRSTNARGYATMAPLREGPAAGQQRVARALYLALVGPIPDGETLDHQCHDPDGCKLGDDCPHRRCVNPLDVEPGAHAVNAARSNAPAAMNARKEACGTCHRPYDGVTTRGDGSTFRTCSHCSARAKRDYKARQRVITG